MLRRRGAAEAGAIYVLVDRLNGQLALFAPGPSDEKLAGERRWFRAHNAEWIGNADAETRLGKALTADPDAFVIEVESRDGIHGLDLVEEG